LPYEGAIQAPDMIQSFPLLLVLHCFHNDCNAANLDQHHDVLVSMAQLLLEFAGLVSVHQALGLVAEVVDNYDCLLLSDDWLRKVSCFGVIVVVVVIACHCHLC
jgi:hypothetical protein